MSKTIGVVGAERSKFTANQVFVVRRLIADLIRGYDRVVSGACHLGGVDLWAVRVAREKGLSVTEYPPETRDWAGYKARNLLIARDADHVVCIVVSRLPLGFKGLTHRLCYHCGIDDHVKSGGCWTAWRAVEMGKTASLVIVGTRIVVRRELKKELSNGIS